MNTTRVQSASLLLFSLALLVIGCSRDTSDAGVKAIGVGYDPGELYAGPEARGGIIDAAVMEMKGTNLDLGVTGFFGSGDAFTDTANDPFKLVLGFSYLFSPAILSADEWQLATPKGPDLVDDCLVQLNSRGPLGSFRTVDVGDSMVLVPGSEVILFRTFMNEVGPRAITAGFPELVHVAFDANVVRLAKAWRGGFYDAKGTWQGRAGKFLDPYGEDIIDMPPGPAFAYLDDANSDWPQPARNDRDVGGQFQGYELDEQRGPIFRYRLGQVNIEEQPVPIPSAGGANLTRRFTLSGDTVDEQLYLLMAEGEQITPQAEHSWAIDGRFTVSLRSRQSLMPVVRSSRGVRQVLVPITVSDGEAVALEVEIAW